VNTSAHRPATGARTTEVDAESAGQRLDNFLLGRLKGVPRAHVYRLIRSGQVRVNSGRTNPAYRLRAGDRVRIPPVSMAAPQVPVTGGADLSWLAQRILYEDSRLLVLDKPAGMAVHGGSGIALGCIEALRALRPGAELELVHRLDRATSGCLLVAKRRSALRALHALLREGAVEKQYLGLVKGSWQHGEKAVDVALTKYHHGPMHIVRADTEGKPAQSVFIPVENYGRLGSLLQIRILTGRTHQIRVHAAHLGHPLAGDERYGDPVFNQIMLELGLKRMFLHAQSVSFAWPENGAEFSATAALPEDLARCLERLALLGVHDRQRFEARLAQGPA
jgi:23S rRNA pseudouridine955/2504/2580 synthase